MHIADWGLELYGISVQIIYKWPSKCIGSVLWIELFLDHWMIATTANR